MKNNKYIKYPKVIDPKTRKWQRYYKQGKCCACSVKAEVSKNYQEDWCCETCYKHIVAHKSAPSAIRFF